MPELPEVETVRKGLERFVVGKRITEVGVLLEKTMRGIGTQLVGRTVISVGRRGKLLLIEMDQDLIVLVHLRMTGQLLLKSKVGGRVLPDSHTRLLVTFDDGEELYFQDQRTFGYWEIAGRDQLSEISFLNRLGVEPLSEEFKLEDFRLNLRKKPKIAIKTFLLDQRNVAGIGNIYADESCFRAGILPWRLCASLSDEEIEKLYVAIREVLELGVELGGASAVNYVDVTGGRGDFMGVAMVYRQQGKACRVCGSVIQKRKFGGRGTHWCPGCQN